MSRLTELASKATPRPWSAPPYIVPWSKDAPDMAYVAGVVMPRVNAALIVALVNNLDAIQALWDAAEVFTCNLDPVESMCAENGVSCNDCLMVELRRAVESLRDLLGGEFAGTIGQQAN